MTDTPGFNPDDMFGPAEPLVPELQAQLVPMDGIPGWVCIRHPLVYSVPHFEQLNGYMNKSLAFKREKVAEAISERAWGRVIALHEKPWRCEALRSIEDFLTDREYWHLLADTWNGSENIRPYLDDWIELWTSMRPEREACMHDHERKALAALPERVEVFRGVDSREGVNGLSWTTSKARGRWFARRFIGFGSKGSFLAKGTVARNDILAYHLRRNEFEVVVRPDLIDNVTVHSI